MLAALLVFVQPQAVAADEAKSSNNSPGRPSPASADQIALWIRELESDQYQVREQATRSLRDAGPVTFDALLEAANSPQLEAADRSVWLLQAFGRSENDESAMAALRRLTMLDRHPTERWQAAQDLAIRSEQICRERLTSLGASVASQSYMLHTSDDPQRVVNLKVTLTEDWHGSEDDLQQISRLDHCYVLQLSGREFNDAVVGSLSSIEMLQGVKLLDSSVTPAAIDQLKEKRPDVTFHLRNDCQLGIEGETVATGVRIVRVVPHTSADDAGLQADDIITRFNGQPLNHFDGLTAHIGQKVPGDEVRLDVLRAEETLTKVVQLGDWDESDRF